MLTLTNLYDAQSNAWGLQKIGLRCLRLCKLRPVCCLTRECERSSDDLHCVLQGAVQAYCELAKKYNITPTQLALAFCRDRPFMASTIIGATNMEQLKENISAFQLPRPLSQEIQDDIEVVFKKFRDPSIS